VLRRVQSKRPIFVEVVFFQPLRFPFAVANALCKLLGSFLGRLKDFAGKLRHAR
jgi:hypothetical protein